MGEAFGTMFHGSVKLEAAVNGLTVPYTIGDMTLTGVRENQKETVKIITRGVLQDVFLGNLTFIQFSFSAKIAQADYTDTTASANTVGDFLRRTIGTDYENNVSTLGADTDVPYTLDISWIIVRNSITQTLKLTDCDYTFDIEEAEDGNTLKISGECLGALTITKS